MPWISIKQNPLITSLWVITNFAKFMRASIIIPAFNSQTFLPSCIDSILSQTIKDFECIIVDDGSSDKTFEICRHYSKKDKRVKVVVQDHYGPGVARNHGLELAKGEYVQFVDSDDLLKPIALEETLKFIESNDLNLALFEGKGIAVDIDPFMQAHVNKQLQMKTNYGLSSGKALFCKMVELENFSSYIFLQMQSRCSLHGKFSNTLMDEELLYSIRSIAESRKAGHLQKKLYIKRGCKGTILTSPLTIEKGIMSLAKAMIEVKDWMNQNAISLGNDAVKCVSKILHLRQKELVRRMKSLSNVQKERMIHLCSLERNQLDAALSMQ